MGLKVQKVGNWRVEGVLPRFMCRFCTAAADERQKPLKSAVVEVPRQSSDIDTPKLPRSHCRPDRPRKQGPRQSVFSSSRRNLALFWLPYKFISLVFRSTSPYTRKFTQKAVFSHSTILSHTKSPKFQPFSIPSSFLPHISLHTPFPSIFRRFCKGKEALKTMGFLYSYAFFFISPLMCN